MCDPVIPIFYLRTEREKTLEILKHLSGLKLRVCIEKLIFLFLNQNICCGYSKERSQ